MCNMRRTTFAIVVITGCLLLNAGEAFAQAKEPDNYGTWIRQQVNKALAAKKAIAENGNGTANQTESPSMIKRQRHWSIRAPRAISYRSR